MVLKSINWIKLKALEYNNEQLILFNREQEFSNLIFYEYNFDGKEIIYKINKTKIEELLAYSGQIFELKYLDYNIGELFKFDNVLNIIINYNSIQKKDLYIRIRQRADYFININNYFCIVTNVSDESDMVSNSFTMHLTDESEVSCFFKKDEDSYLVLLCKAKKSGIFSFGNIEKEIKIENINIKYNFIIIRDINTYSFYCEGKGGSVLFVTPTFYDFYLNYSYVINYYSKENKNLFGIKFELNNNTEVKCIKKNKLGSCNVTRYHFVDSTATRFYMYHYVAESNYYDIFGEFYELSPIIGYVPYSFEIVLKINNINNKNKTVIGQNGFISFITDYEDTSSIFDPSDMEKETLKVAYFSGEKKNIKRVVIYGNQKKIKSDLYVNLKII